MQNRDYLLALLIKYERFFASRVNGQNRIKVKEHLCKYLVLVAWYFHQIVSSIVTLSQRFRLTNQRVYIEPALRFPNIIVTLTTTEVFQNSMRATTETVWDLILLTSSRVLYSKFHEIDNIMDVICNAYCIIYITGLCG